MKMRIRIFIYNWTFKIVNCHRVLRDDRHGVPIEEWANEFMYAAYA